MGKSMYKLIKYGNKENDTLRTTHFEHGQQGQNKVDGWSIEHRERHTKQMLTND